MPFSGPRSYDTGGRPAVLEYDLEQQEKERQFDDALRVASSARAPSRAPETMPLPAMHPAEAMAGAPGRNRANVMDSPVFDQNHTGGPTSRTWDFGPNPAELEGQTAATAQLSADKTRYQGLQNIPGITPKMAARMVYGRSGVMDEPEPDQMRSAMAEYLRNPTRESAARAVQIGVDANKFPDRFLSVRRDPKGGELPLHPDPLVRGTPEYEAAFDREEGIRAKYNMQEREITARNQERDDFRTERRNAATDVNARTREFQSALRTRPKPSQFADPLTRQVDQRNYDEAVTNFKADSAETANALQQAHDHLRMLSGDSPVVPDPRPTRRGAPTAAPASPPGGNTSQSDQADLAQEMQDAIRKIMASSLPAAEKSRRVAAVNARANAILSGGKSGGTSGGKP